LIGVDEQMIRESPFALIGTPDQIADDLIARREQFGFSYIIVGGAEADAFAPVVARLANT
jgi:alkanesulfonate monooxygenase SsuD/methylene tetrahydromethanopterin reductase-like flavin-dependent oxidoreductase (luciferase family)